MEQSKNYNRGSGSTLPPEQDAQAWCSVGSVAALWVGRLEAQREGRGGSAEIDYVPLAWAAE